MLPAYLINLFLIFFVMRRLQFNSLNANFTKWSSTLKKFVGNLPTNCLSVFDHFVGLLLKGLIITARFLFCLFVGKKLKEQVLMFFYSLEIITYLLSS